MQNAHVRQLAPMPWASWRDEYDEKDVQEVLSTIGLAWLYSDTAELDLETAFEIETDGDITLRFLSELTFEQLISLKEAFEPKRLTIDVQGEYAPSLRSFVQLPGFIVVLSWNTRSAQNTVETAGAEAT